MKNKNNSYTLKHMLFKIAQALKHDIKVNVIV